MKTVLAILILSAFLTGCASSHKSDAPIPAPATVKPGIPDPSQP